MTNIFYGKVNTKGEYKDLSAVTEISVVSDTVYLLQPQGVISLYVGSSLPEEGGFLIFNNNITRFKLNAGEKIYIKTYNDNGVYINLAS